MDILTHVPGFILFLNKWGSREVGLSLSSFRNQTHFLPLLRKEKTMLKTRELTCSQVSKVLNVGQSLRLPGHCSVSGVGTKSVVLCMLLFHVITYFY